MRALVKMLGILFAASAVAQATDAPPSSNAPASPTATPAQQTQPEAIDPDEAKAGKAFRDHRAAMLASLTRSASPRDWALAQLLDGSFEFTATQKAPKENTFPQAAAALPDDALVQWITVVAPRNASRERDAALQSLKRLEPDNAAIWLWELDRTDRKNPAAAEATLAHMAASTRYNDHRADLLRALVDVHQRYPMPPESYADPLAASVKDLAPYIFAMMEVNQLQQPFQLLSSLCTIDPVSGKNATHAEPCDAIGRLLARHGTSYTGTRIGFALLRVSHNFKDDDVRSARGQDWVVEQYQALQTAMSEGFGDATPPSPDQVAQAFGAMRTFVQDQIETGSELEAYRQALVRAGKPLTPPTEWVDEQSPFSPARLRADEERAAKERERAASLPPTPTSRTAMPPPAH